jgi:hypothetical protein
MKLEFIEARDLPDAWFQCVYQFWKLVEIQDRSRSFRPETASLINAIRVKYPGVGPFCRTFPFMGIESVAEGIWRSTSLI